MKVWQFELPSVWDRLTGLPKITQNTFLTPKLSDFRRERS